jgi:hypothetical protein
MSAGFDAHLERGGNRFVAFSRQPLSLPNAGPGGAGLLNLCNLQLRIAPRNQPMVKKHLTRVRVDREARFIAVIAREQRLRPRKMM